MVTLYGIKTFMDTSETAANSSLGNRLAEGITMS